MGTFKVLYLSLTLACIVLNLYVPCSVTWCMRRDVFSICFMKTDNWHVFISQTNTLLTDLRNAMDKAMHCSENRFPVHLIKPLTPNDHYRGRTAPLTSTRCILYIYSTNIGTENFKHGTYSSLFSLQNIVCFIILT